MQKPEIYPCNGYDLIKGDDFKWRVWDDDHPVAGPFELLIEAEEAARQLPSRDPLG